MQTEIETESGATGGAVGAGRLSGTRTLKASTESRWDGMQQYTTHSIPQRRREVIVPERPHSSLKAPMVDARGRQREEAEDEPEPEPELQAVNLFANVDMFAVGYKPPSLAPKKQPGKKLFFSKIAEGLESRAFLAGTAEKKRLRTLVEELDAIGLEPRGLETLRERACLAGVPRWRLAACEPAIAQFDKPPSMLCHEVRHTVATMIAECELGRELGCRRRADVVDIFLTEPAQNGFLGFKLTRDSYTGQHVLASVSAEDHEPGFRNGAIIAQHVRRGDALTKVNGVDFKDEDVEV